MSEHFTGILLHYIRFFFCRIRTCNDGCNKNEQMKVDLVFINSISLISTACITEYLNKDRTYFVCTMLTYTKA